MAWKQVTITDGSKKIQAQQNGQRIFCANNLGVNPKQICINDVQYTVLSQSVDDRDGTINLIIDVPKGTAKGKADGKSIKKPNTSKTG
jgi:hypothetical protein